MADPLTITAIITGIASAIVAILGGIHYRLKIKCGMCCQSDCTENETQREIKKIKINSVSSIKSI
jgi:predicted benzoate:H+ symporter BenE